MDISLSAVTPSDLGQLLSLMREYYFYDQIPFDEVRARAALEAMLADSRHGEGWLIIAGGEVAGYLLLTRCFSIEFGGSYALLDELFVRERFRGAGIGRGVLAFVREHCRQHQVAVLRLEVETRNVAAQRLYESEGFCRHERFLLTHWLSNDPP